MFHTHFNHPKEITDHPGRHPGAVFARVFVRNQSVLIRGVNDSVEVMGQLPEAGWPYVNVHPYHVYIHDMVQGPKTCGRRSGKRCALKDHARIDGGL